MQIPLICEPHDWHDAARRDGHYANQDDTGGRDTIGTISNPPLGKGRINNRPVVMLIGNSD